MLLFSFVPVLMFVGIGRVNGGHELGQQIYQEMCSDKDFQDGMVKCLSSLPTRDQLVFKLCGSVSSNETVEDFSEILENMCSNKSCALTTLFCIHDVSHVMKHLNEKHDHDHDHDHDHEHEHEHDHHHHGHHDHDHEHEEDEDHEHDDDHEQHHHHHHHHHHPHAERTFLSQECFLNLYEAYNLTTPTSSETTSVSSEEED